MSASQIRDSEMAGNERRAASTPEEPLSIRINCYAGARRYQLMTAGYGVNGAANGAAKAAGAW
jgi:hypothetical protein